MLHSWSAWGESIAEVPRGVAVQATLGGRGGFCSQIFLYVFPCSLRQDDAASVVFDEDLHAEPPDDLSPEIQQVPPQEGQLEVLSEGEGPEQAATEMQQLPTADLLRVWSEKVSGILQALRIADLHCLPRDKHPSLVGILCEAGDGLALSLGASRGDGTSRHRAGCSRGVTGRTGPSRSSCCFLLLGLSSRNRSGTSHT